MERGSPANKDDLLSVYYLMMHHTQLRRLMPSFHATFEDPTKLSGLIRSTIPKTKKVLTKFDLLFIKTVFNRLNLSEKPD